MKKLNLVGRQVSRLRYQRGWSQEELAGRLYDAGWLAATRSTISKIEGGTIYVHDFQVTWLAAVLDVPEAALYPKFDSSKPIQDSILQHIRNAKRGLVLPLASFSHSS
jgi:transcriptional regulator with XRE-family HTH domain